MEVPQQQHDLHTHSQTPASGPQPSRACMSPLASRPGYIIIGFNQARNICGISGIRTPHFRFDIHHSPSSLLLNMSATRSPTPTLNGEPRSSPRQSKAFPHSTTMESRDLGAEQRAEKDAEDTDDLRPAEGPGARMPAPEKFAHTGESSRLESNRLLVLSVAHVY